MWLLIGKNKSVSFGSSSWDLITLSCLRTNTPHTLEIQDEVQLTAKHQKYDSHVFSDVLALYTKNTKPVDLMLKCGQVTW